MAGAMTLSADSNNTGLEEDHFQSFGWLRTQQDFQDFQDWFKDTFEPISRVDLEDLRLKLGLIPLSRR